VRHERRVTFALTLLAALGSGLYLVGTMLVTNVRNVPQNDAMARVDPESDESEDDWRDSSLPGRGGTQCGP
jgi:uncharacterized membrane protein